MSIHQTVRARVLSIGVNLRGIGRLKPQLHDTLPAYRACAARSAPRRFQNLDFSSVRAGGLGFCSRDFQSPRLKLTPMDNTLAPTKTCIESQ